MNSDIEDEEMEFIPNRRGYVQPALCAPLEINEVKDKPAEIPAANATAWGEEATTPDELESTVTNGLQ